MGMSSPHSCSGQVQLTWGSTRSYLRFYSNLWAGNGEGTEREGLQVP